MRHVCSNSTHNVTHSTHNVTHAVWTGGGSRHLREGLISSAYPSWFPRVISFQNLERASMCVDGLMGRWSCRTGSPAAVSSGSSVICAPPFVIVVECRWLRKLWLRAAAKDCVRRTSVGEKITGPP